MKQFILVIFTSFFICHSNAQPGDIIKYKLAQFERITEKLKTDSSNVALRWERIDIVFTNPPINFYDHGICQEDTVKYPEWYSENCRFSYKGVYVIDELNKLINEKAQLVVLGGRNEGIDDTVYYAPSCFYEKRGDYYYIKGKWEKALADYQQALVSMPVRLKQYIYYKIAALYYQQFRLDSANKQWNLQQSLRYIDILIPPVYDSTIRPVKDFQHFTDRCMEEKILLLKEMKNYERLCGYLKYLVLSYYNVYSFPGDTYKDYRVSALHWTLHYTEMLIHVLKEIDVDEERKKALLESVFVIFRK